MKRKIGILGGISLASTLEYAATIARKYYDRFGDYYYPEMILYSLDFQKFTDMENEGRLGDYADYIAMGINALQRAGADFAIMSANSPHSALSAVQERTALPILSIVDAVGKQARLQQMKHVLLTGIYYTMQNTFYQNGLAAHGITVKTPDEADQKAIDEIIFSRLARNVISEHDREQFLAILSRYPTDGVILGCTELPLLLSQEQTTIPLLNSLDLHCTAALNYALGEM